MSQHIRAPARSTGWKIGDRDADDFDVALFYAGTDLKVIGGHDHSDYRLGAHPGSRFRALVGIYTYKEAERQSQDSDH
jgi:hypothetical protein